jgi:hypothetical protein
MYARTQAMYLSTTDNQILYRTPENAICSQAACKWIERNAQQKENGKTQVSSYPLTLGANENIVLSLANDSRTRSTRRCGIRRRITSGRKLQVGGSRRRRCSLALRNRLLDGRTHFSGSRWDLSDFTRTMRHRFARSKSTQPRLSLG